MPAKSIEELDLVSFAQAAAEMLRAKHPDIVFYQRRRDIQARVADLACRLRVSILD